MDLSTLPHAPGVYLMRDHAGQTLYIGKAQDLAKRVSSYFIRGQQSSFKIGVLLAAIHHIDYIPAASEREALLVEQNLIKKIQPPFNTMWRDDKSYPYLKLTMSEDFPRFFMTRTHKRDGSHYFGPYPHVGQMKRLLRYLWKNRFFPLRPCRYEFSEAKPLPLEKAKQCLYYHTRECPAPCVGRISKEDYRQIAKDAELFFGGKYKALLDQWKQEMKDASAKMDFERAAQLRDHMAALEHMDQRVTVRQIDQEQAEARVDRSRGVTELQQALGLKHPPMRIECFDISHIQGVETVASMVVFEGGHAKKSDYRKFKIKTVSGIDDFASMAEVVGRRYRRLKAEQSAYPDLILIDGGKGQLSAAMKTLKDLFAPAKIPMPVAALAKREEELFLPDREAPILLPKDAPALHLVQRVRDEAHRFAITFHRQRRTKRAFH